MDAGTAFLTNLGIAAVVVPVVLLIFNYCQDPRKILERLSELTGNEPGSAASSGSGGRPPAKRYEYWWGPARRGPERAQGTLERVG
eukprot:CAMPEP_0179104196 /NCGR_PEP_ID=MMETSP0796-20121207/48321_1 /TAXON_ID=73915 /ORGANISM="Pyrodinium bahamense, Strain pbaha01" /LENGTH=85 /DNA_ID=CAMNT_0020802131 /DNA_START=70 /DNA_END=324 /DNA_ORIENTATION=+